MNKWDKIFVGKKYLDSVECIEIISRDISNTTDMQKAIIDGLGIKDERPLEMHNLFQVMEKIELFVFKKGFTLEDLNDWIEEYKKVSFVEMMKVSQNKTLDDNFYLFE